MTHEERSWIVMDAPPEREDCRPFIRVATLMRAAGLHVPEIIAQDLERGLLLLSDLGTTTYLKALDNGNADALFRDAIHALVDWQLASRPDALPPYGEALLTREIALFPEWYIGRHLEIALDAREREMLAKGSALLVANALAQPRVYVHRDYMPRNLMVSEPNPGILDFQDAVWGPITYDVVSLFRDAFISWDEAQVLDWTVRLRMDGAAASPQSARDLRADSLPRRQARVPRGHAAFSPLCARGVRALQRACADPCGA